MRVCSKCKLPKPLSQFNFKVKDRGVRQYQCIECTRAFVRDHYQRNRNYYLVKAQKRNQKQRTEARIYVKEYLSVHPCIDCGESDIVVLEFDHRQHKFSEIASLIAGRYPLRKVQEEIEKCDVRCANCHRRKTARERDWFKGSDKMSP